MFPETTAPSTAAVAPLNMNPPEIVAELPVKVPFVMVRLPALFQIPPPDVPALFPETNAFSTTAVTVAATELNRNPPELVAELPVKVPPLMKQVDPL